MIFSEKKCYQERYLESVYKRRKDFTTESVFERMERVLNQDDRAKRVEKRLTKHDNKHMSNLESSLMRSSYFQPALESEPAKQDDELTLDDGWATRSVINFSTTSTTNTAPETSANSGSGRRIRKPNPYEEEKILKLKEWQNLFSNKGLMYENVREIGFGANDLEKTKVVLDIFNPKRAQKAAGESEEHVSGFLRSGETIRSLMDKAHLAGEDFDALLRTSRRGTAADQAAAKRRAQIAVKKRKEQEKLAQQRRLQGLKKKDSETTEDSEEDEDEDEEESDEEESEEEESDSEEDEDESDASPPKAAVKAPVKPKPVEEDSDEDEEDDEDEDEDDDEEDIEDGM